MKYSEKNVETEAERGHLYSDRSNLKGPLVRNYNEMVKI